ncbi:hypothetical protein H2200_001421 [Cladophialophora chaetospira]|uniref:Uncharacterized protein n=1 Tax=Cladophialophora chaetospira TaxID=386627 RepID=A0AA38XKY6_9EURO|nr:hypothetical protein H2200_001421 [Cladophialophora chaetospira]
MILAQLEHQSLAHLTLRIPSTDNIHDIIADRQDTLYPQIRGTLADFMSGLNSLTLKLSYSSGRLERVYPRTPNMIVHIVKSHGKYYQDMFDFAAMATSLKSLRIHFTAPYRLDQLKLKGFRVLKALSLSGIRTTGQPLLSLLAQNKTSLESVFLHRIELIEKSWEDVLVVLCESPLLTSVAFQSCINAAHGRFSQYNFHITPGNVDITPASVDITPGSIDSRDLEPERLHDHTALRALIRLVNGRTRESRLSEPELAF